MEQQTAAERPTDEREKTKWYHADRVVVIAILCVGPLALPLVWWHPRYRLITKAVITGAVVAVTVWACMFIGESYSRLQEQLRTLQSY